MLKCTAILALASFCVAVPAPQQDELGGLISSVFTPPPGGSTLAPLGNAAPVENAAPLPGSLDSLIAEVYGPNKTTNGNLPGTILGTENTPAPKPDNCECVPYYQCHEGKILENGVGLIDIRSGFDDKNTERLGGGFGPCENYLEVCCQPPNVIRNKDDKILPTNPVERTGCGQRHPNGVGFRITGDKDNEAQFGEFPWMVAILKEEPIGNQGEKLNVYQCGGALIHRRAVLTGAHCVNGRAPETLRIRAGEWDTQTKQEVFPHQDRTVQTVIAHKGFHSGALFNDFAILILTEPVELAENVDVVCLPDVATEINDNNCYASGWGKDMFGKEGHYQVILKKIGLPLVPTQACQDALRKTRLGTHFVLDESFICAGGQSGKDTCKGDGGSPLVCPLKNDPNRFVQAGIVAWGIGCGDEIPAVYGNVRHARQWIDDQMRSHNLETTSYTYTPPSL